MAASALAQFSLRADIDLHVMTPNQRPTDVIARTLLALPPVFADLRPDVVLVQGDTSSTFAGALAAYHDRIPVGHVEAGLRTDDIYSPFPEEMNRRMTSAVATFHFGADRSSRAASSARRRDCRPARASLAATRSWTRCCGCARRRRRRPACASPPWLANDSAHLSPPRESRRAHRRHLPRGPRHRRGQAGRQRRVPGASESSGQTADASGARVDHRSRHAARAGRKTPSCCG